VSTNNGQDPEVQLAEIRQFCNRRDWTTVQEYVDKGISGSKERRPALDKLLADCRKRAVDCVVVYRYDRFARSLRQLVNALEEFRALGIDFVSLRVSTRQRPMDDWFSESLPPSQNLKGN
jgi:DNA invertase Pin-like site-specific DNA recombinase